jgi:hypothetical protein
MQNPSKTRKNLKNRDMVDHTRKRWDIIKVTSGGNLAGNPGISFQQLNHLSLEALFLFPASRKQK